MYNLALQNADWQTDDKAVEMQIGTTTLDGEPQVAEAQDRATLVAAAPPQDIHARHVAKAARQHEINELPGGHGREGGRQAERRAKSKKMMIDAFAVEGVPRIRALDEPRARPQLDVDVPQPEPRGHRRRPGHPSTRSSGRTGRAPCRGRASR